MCERLKVWIRSALPGDPRFLCRRIADVAVLVLFLILISMSLQAVVALFHGRPATYPNDIEEHFKYGSIGSDNLRGGLPYWILKVLPEVFSDHDCLNGRAGYEAFGLIVEDGDDHDRPVGFSKRRVGGKRIGVDMVGMNCAACHASRVHGNANVISGMPSNTVDVERFFVFLFETAKDPRFNADILIPAIDRRMAKERHEAMGVIDRLMYQGLIHLYRFEIGKLERKFYFLGKTEHCQKGAPRVAGPGRIDTWAPYKVLTLQSSFAPIDFLPHLSPSWFDPPDMEVGDAVGFADISSLWNLEQRLGRGLHWDGNTTLLTESGITAAVGSGATPAALDLDGLVRIAVWLRTLNPPAYDAYAPSDYKVDGLLSTRGKALYAEHCASCHSPHGSRFGQVEPIEDIGTDTQRVDAFTEELAHKLNYVGHGYTWRFRNFTKTKGYSNLPLDGIWLRAPYLHNGSVPTLWHLLTPEERPTKFYRGNNRYDWKRGGFISDVEEQDGHEFFSYDTGLKGNGNGGHLTGATLPADEKKALLEYLKTL